MNKKQFQISISGLGIIFYSPQSVKHIEEGEDYLGEHYSIPQDVIKHIYEGSIVGIATGTPGDFYLNIYQSIQPDIENIAPDYALMVSLQKKKTRYTGSLYREREKLQNQRVNYQLTN